MIGLWVRYMKKLIALIVLSLLPVSLSLTRAQVVMELPDARMPSGTPNVELIFGKPFVTYDPTAEPARNDGTMWTWSMVELKAVATGFSTSRLKFSYTLSGGQIIHHGWSVWWDLGGLKPGVYSVTAVVEGDDEVVATTTGEIELRRVTTNPDPVGPEVGAEVVDEEDTGEDEQDDAPNITCQLPPIVSVGASTGVLYLNEFPDEDERKRGGQTNSVLLRTTAADPNGFSLLYTYSVTGGRIIGKGPEVQWDFSDVEPGIYTVAVEVNNGVGGLTRATRDVDVRR